MQDANGKAGVILSDAEITMQEENRDIGYAGWRGSYREFSGQGYHPDIRQAVYRYGSSY